MESGVRNLFEIINSRMWSTADQFGVSSFCLDQPNCHSPPTTTFHTPSQRGRLLFRIMKYVLVCLLSFVRHSSRLSLCMCLRSTIHHPNHSFPPPPPENEKVKFSLLTKNFAPEKEEEILMANIGMTIIYNGKIIFPFCIGNGGSAANEKSMRKADTRHKKAL